MGDAMVRMRLAAWGLAAGRERLARTRARFALAATLAVMLILCGCATRQLMPTPNLYLNAASDPFATVPAHFRTSEVDVLYVTDRVGERRKDGRLEYGYGRSASLAFGACVVEIGDDVDWRTLVRESTTAKRQTRLELAVKETVELCRFPATPQTPDDVDAGLRASRELVREIERRLEFTETKELFVFVHGYNNTFEGAVFSIAELWHFLGREGVPVAYTWPAGYGTIKGYAYDRESGEFTIYHLKQFLKAVADCGALDSVNIIAHSRGSDVVMTALRELFIEARAAGADPKEVYAIENVVLFAPDLDLDVTLQRVGAERVGTGVSRVTVYVSAFDRAIGLASWLFTSTTRLGRLRASDISGHRAQKLGQLVEIDVVDVRVKTGGVGHSYYRESPEAASDLVLLLRYNLPPGAEYGRPLGKELPNYYFLTEGYPQRALQ